jgi:hypothetical protein
MVVTPGATIERTWSNTWRTMWPLCRIRSISAADLQTIAMLTYSDFAYSDFAKPVRHHAHHHA